MNSAGLNCTSPAISVGKRDYVISVVRVIAMWMIIGCHISSWLSISSLAMVLNVGVYIFLLISGILYAKKSISDSAGFIKNRWLKLCIPMYYLVIFLLFFNLFSLKTDVLKTIPTYLFNLQGLEFIIPRIRLYQMNGLGHLWFLTVIMLCYFLLIPLKKSEENIRNWSTYIPLIFIILFLASIFLAYTIKVQLNYFIAFLLGYMIGKHTFKVTAPKYLVSTLCMIFAMMIRLLCKNYADGTIMYNDLVVPFTHIVLAFWIYQTVQFTAQCAPNIMKFCSESKAINWLDRSSLYLYMTHYMFLVGPIYVNMLPFSKPIQLLFFLIGTFASGIALRYISEKTIHRISSWCLQK